MSWFAFTKRSNINEMVAQAKATNSMLVDVRTVEEYEQGHIPGSVNVPLDSLEDISGRAGQDSPLYVYCHSGARSARATAQLRRMGYINVNDMGGIMNWNGAIARGGNVQ